MLWSILLCYSSLTNYKQQRRHFNPRQSIVLRLWATGYSILCINMHSCRVNIMPSDALAPNTIRSSEATMLNLHIGGGSSLPHWQPKVAMMPTLSSLVAPKVVIMTTCGTTRDAKLASWKLFSFQCLKMDFNHPRLMKFMESPRTFFPKHFSALKLKELKI